MSPTITAISQVFDALGRVPLIVGALTKGTLLILIAVGLTRALSNAPAAARHSRLESRRCRHAPPAGDDVDPVAPRADGSRDGP